MARKKPKKSEPPSKAAAFVPPQSSRKTWLAALGLAVAGILAYGTTIKNPFIFDDAPHILQNVNIRALFPPFDAMFSPFNISRPILGLSLAFNYAISGFDTWSYHVFNIAVHILAALTLFGLLRRTLYCERLRERYSGSATALAFCAALLWLVHPLQTQAVTYVIQRSESMMGLFYLLTLYCMSRGAASPYPIPWYGGAVAAVVLGIGCKPVIATAPVAACLYDAVFVAGSFKGALRLRWRVYAAMAGTWVLIPLLLFFSDANIKTAGFHIQGLTPWNYASTQFGVILHYLRLSFWPNPRSLVFDYGWPVATKLSEVLPPALVIGAMLLASAAALIRRSVWGFVGAWFFLILAPTSSVMPIEDIAAEHRMYLSLASVCALLVFGVHAILLRLLPGPSVSIIRRINGIVLISLAAALLITWTFLRNVDFQSETGMWGDVIFKRPENVRAYANLGFALSKNGKLDEAVKLYEQALRLKPDHVQSNFDLGSILMRTEPPDLPGAIAHFREAVRVQPGHSEAHYNLGCALSKLGRREEAIAEYLETLKYRPHYADAHYNLANEYFSQKKYAESIKHNEEAISSRPGFAAAYSNLGAALMEAGKLEEAAAKLATAADLDPNSQYTQNNLGSALFKLGRIDEAITHFRLALRIDPDFTLARSNLDKALQQQQKRR